MSLAGRPFSPIVKFKNYSIEQKRKKAAGRVINLRQGFVSLFVPGANPGKLLIRLFIYLLIVLCVSCSLSFSLYLRTCHVSLRCSLLSDLTLVIGMRASLSKSDNELSSASNAKTSRLKRHHSIDDDCPMIPSVTVATTTASASLSDEEKQIHVRFHPDLASFDHRVPLMNGNTHPAAVLMQTSSFSSEIMVGSKQCIGISIFFLISLESRAMVFTSGWSSKRSFTTRIDRKWRCCLAKRIADRSIFRVLVPVLSGIYCLFSSRIIGIATVRQTVQIHWLNYRLIFLFTFSLSSIQVRSTTFHLFTSCSSVSLARCSRVNKLWYYLCSHPELWRQLAQQKKWSFSSLPLDQQQIESYTDEHGKSQVGTRNKSWRMSHLDGLFPVEIHLYRTIPSSVALVKWQMRCENLSWTRRRSEQRRKAKDQVLLSISRRLLCSIRQSNDHQWLHWWDDQSVRFTRLMANLTSSLLFLAGIWIVRMKSLLWWAIHVVSDVYTLTASTKFV